MGIPKLQRYLRAVCAWVFVFATAYSCNSYGQVSGPYGFDWYINPANVQDQYCQKATLRPSDLYYMPYTPWTPPYIGSGVMQMTKFKAIIGTVPTYDSNGFPFPETQPPDYPGYFIYVYDTHTHFVGNDIVEGPDAPALKLYLKKYEFRPPYTGKVNFQEVGMMKYKGGTDIPIRMWEVEFDLSMRDSEAPPSPVQLQGDHRYWFTVVGDNSDSQESTIGTICLGRTNSATIPSVPPSPPISFELSQAQFNNWNPPNLSFPQPFNLAFQDFFRIGDPDQHYCTNDECPINPSNSIPPAFPNPNCLSDPPLVLTCCQKTLPGRNAIKVQVNPSVTPLPTVTATTTATATITPTYTTPPPPTNTATATFTPIPTIAATSTMTATFTSTPSSTVTPTSTPTKTPKFKSIYDSLAPALKIAPCKIPENC